MAFVFIAIGFGLCLLLQATIMLERRWYEANAFGTKENGKIRFFYGYIFAPNKKFVKDKLKEKGYPAIGYISREDWNVYIK